MKPEIEIDNWAVTTHFYGKEAYVAPEARSKVLIGHVTGHPTMGDADVHTSYIVRFDLACRRVETHNTIYVLGAPKPGFIEYAMEHSSAETVRALRVGGVVPTPSRMRIRSDIDGSIAVTRGWTDEGVALVLDEDRFVNGLVDGFVTKAVTHDGRELDVRKFSTLSAALTDYAKRVEAAELGWE
jgi:hypothetical protein